MTHSAGQWVDNMGVHHDTVTTMKYNNEHMLKQKKMSEVVVE